MKKSHVQVGISVIVVKDKTVLVGRRKGSHAAGLLSFPGGHLDFGEDWKACAYREIREECGAGLEVVIRHFDQHQIAFFTTNDVMPECGKHYVTIFLVADWVSGEPVNAEPEKCEGWAWASLAELKKERVAGWIPLKLLESAKYRIGI